MALLALVGGWTLGLYLASRFSLPLPAALLFLTALGALLLLSRARRPLGLGILLAFALVVGTLRGDATLDGALGDLQQHNGRPVALQGVVVTDPEPAGRFIRFRLAADHLRVSDELVPVTGEAMVWVEPGGRLLEERSYPHIRYGDRLELQGRLAEAPVFADFDYRDHLARQGVASVMTGPQVSLVEAGKGNPALSWIFGVRRRLAASLEDALPEPQAALTQSLLLGLRGNLPDSLERDFRATGTLHLLAISGLHVGVVLGVILAASQWALGRRRHLYLVAPVLAVWLYALVSGMSPSVTRAAIMGSAYLAALALGRHASALPALALAAGIMVGVEPRLLWDLSFQLSFTAMAGVALLAPPLSRGALALANRVIPQGQGLRPLVSPIVVALSIGAAATAGTLPLVAFNFHQVPLLGIPATLLALPALPGILVGGALTGALGVAGEGAAQLVAWVPWALEWYLVRLVELFSLVPGATVQVGSVAPGLVAAYYALLLGGLLLGRRLLRLRAAGDAVPRLLTPPSRRAWRGAILGGGALLAALLWTAALAQPDGQLHLYFLDVGQGDAILLRTPNGHSILVDGGPDPRITLPALDRRLPLWDRDVDLAVLTHPDADHLAGLVTLARRGRLQRVLEPPPEESPSALFLSWDQALDDRRVPRLEAVMGQVIQTEDGVRIEVLNPPSPPMVGTSRDRNNNSVVLRVVYGRFTALLTSDLQGEGELSLLDRQADVDVVVLKVAHHGAGASSQPQFVEAVTPQVAVISVGAENPFGHPAPGTLQALRERLPPEHLFITSEVGTVEVVTDGARLWVQQER